MAIKEKILEQILKKKYGLTVEDISKILKINRITASKYLAILEVEGKIDVRNIGKTKLH
jgi:predicted ArsR family transcriptional regulator